MTLAVGGAENMTATVVNTDDPMSYGEISAHSNNESVATVESYSDPETGSIAGYIVTAIGEGNAEIIFEADNLEAVCNVTVTPAGA